MKKTFKWGIMIAVLMVFGLAAVSYLYGVSHRKVEIIKAKMALNVSYMSYQTNGYVTNYSSYGNVKLSSDEVAISGTNYHCILKFEARGFEGKGMLAMTTDQVFIWLDSTRPPKIIGNDYRPPFFSQSF